MSEIPAEARPLIQHLVEQRLLATDVAKDTGENTIEPAHEALLRQWGLLEGWLAEDAGLLAVLEGVKRASRDWAANNQDRAWLDARDGSTGGGGAAAARGPTSPPTWSRRIASTSPHAGRWRRMQERRKRRVQAVIYVLLVGIIAGLVGWINQSYIKEQWIGT